MGPYSRQLATCSCMHCRSRTWSPGVLFLGVNPHEVSLMAVFLCQSFPCHLGSFHRPPYIYITCMPFRLHPTSKCGYGHQAQTSQVEVFNIMVATSSVLILQICLIMVLLLHLQKVWIWSEAKFHWHWAPGSACMSCTHDNVSHTQGTAVSSQYKALVDPNLQLNS